MTRASERTELFNDALITRAAMERLIVGGMNGVLCQARIALKPCDFRCTGVLVIIGIISSLPLHFLLLTVAGVDDQR